MDNGRTSVRLITTLILSFCLLLGSVQSYAEETSGEEIIEGTGYTSPQAYRRESMWQAVKSIWDDDASIATFYLLLPFLFERLVALRQLFTQIPAALRAGFDIAKYREFKKEYRDLRALMKKIQSERPELIARLRETATTHSEVVKKLNDHIERMKQTHEKGYQWYDGSLKDAVDSWTREGETARLDEWVKENREDFHALGGVGRNTFDDWEKERNHENWIGLNMTEREYLRLQGKKWFEEYDRLRKEESRSARDLVSRANQLTQVINSDIPLDERFPSLTSEDTLGHRAPGKLYMPGKAAGMIRLSTEEIEKVMGDRCENAMAHLGGKASELGTKGTFFGVLGKGGVVLMPFFTLGSAAGMGYLTWRAYARTAAKYGDIEAARIKAQHEAQIKRQIAARAEGSLSAEIANRQKEIDPFTQALIKELRNRKQEILDKATEIATLHPELAFDVKSKLQILDDPKQLEYQIIRAIPFAIQKNLASEGDINFDQLKKFIAVAPSDPSGRTTSHQLVNDIYERVLTNVFPELSHAVTGPSGTTVSSAGERISSGGLTNPLIADTLKSIEKLDIKYPEDVPHHPSIPIGK